MAFRVWLQQGAIGPLPLFREDDGTAESEENGTSAPAPAQVRAHTIASMRTSLQQAAGGVVRGYHGLAAGGVWGNLRALSKEFTMCLVFTPACLAHSQRARVVSCELWTVEPQCN